MNAYEAKKAERVERLHERAERLAGEAEGAVARARTMAAVIPFGQPILVGHHSEGRDRRYRGRIDATFRKGFELAKEAVETARRAERAENSTAVSSDDPEAVTKLREKVAALVAHGEAVKAANKLLRAAHPPTGATIKAVAVLLGWTPERCAAHLGALHSMGQKTFSTTNGSAERRRLEARIAELERRAAAPAVPAEVVGTVRIEESENRVRVFFPGKPSDETRANLKRGGFRWAPTVGAWLAYPSETARSVARKAAEAEGCARFRRRDIVMTTKKEKDDATAKTLAAFGAGFAKSLKEESDAFEKLPKTHDHTKGEFVEEVDPKLADKHLE